MIETYLARQRRLVEQALHRYLPRHRFPSTIFESMRHGLFAGGKRLRPILTLAAAEAVGGRAEQVMPVACAIEYIHTYSLVHDDLPALDNDDFRRGQLTTHKCFGEAMAILAGDALLTHAFQVMTDPKLMNPVPSALVLEVAHEIATAIGTAGMIGGQVIDIQSEGIPVNRRTLRHIHTRKTGALIQVAVRAGALLGGGSEAQVKALSRYGEKIGFAFQITDDLLDLLEGPHQEPGKPGRLGKIPGRDAERKKATYPAVFGVERSRVIAARMSREAIRALHAFGEQARPLRELARFVVQRGH